jgi:hypothetical protein
MELQADKTREYPAIHEGDDITRQIDEGACESDRAFFRAHPKRRFRLRPAWTAEIEDFARHGAIRRMLPDELMWWVIVHQLALGVRVRFPLSAPHHFPTEVSEADARHVWRQRCPHEWQTKLRQAGRELRKIIHEE